MRRTVAPKNYEQKLDFPDIINSSISHNFTQIPNELLRNPDLSFKAKGLLCLLLSNKQGWHSYLQTLSKMTKEGETAIRTGIQELEEANYLIRVQYRDKKTKVRRGSFWAYTDVAGQFNIKKTLYKLDKKGLEAMFYNKDTTHKKTDTVKPDVEKPEVGNPLMENQGLIILSNKNTNNKNTKEHTVREKEKQNISNCDSNGYLFLANKLYEIIKTSKNIKFSQSKISRWADEIRKLVENNEVELSRVERALNWYANNIGAMYVPVIESGSSLREKFIRLESAIERDPKEAKRNSKYSNLDISHY